VADGFRVDLGALEDAAAGINQTLNDLKAKRIDDLDGLTESLRERVATVVGAADDRFRSYTVDDPTPA
jgi:hypothetical protein